MESKRTIECESTDNGRYFMNPDHLRLFEQIWRPANGINVRALVFIIHGLNEHSSFHYEDTIVKPLNKIGCVVVSHDHVGHGRSEGNRKVIVKIENMARDVVAHIDNIRYRESMAPTIPTLLYGHSLGGLIACTISRERPELILGMVLESPALCVTGKPGSSWLSCQLGRAVSVVKPEMVISRPLFTNLSRNETIVKDAIEDSLRNKGGLTLGTAVNITSAIKSFKSKLKEIKTPFFVVHGEKDSIVSIEGSHALNKEAGVEDKLFHIYEDSLHLLRGDAGGVGEDFSRRLVDWVDQHIK